MCSRNMGVHVQWLPGSAQGLRKQDKKLDSCAANKVQRNLYVATVQKF